MHVMKNYYFRLFILFELNPYITHVYSCSRVFMGSVQKRGKRNIFSRTLVYSTFSLQLENSRRGNIQIVSWSLDSMIFRRFRRPKWSGERLPIAYNEQNEMKEKYFKRFFHVNTRSLPRVCYMPRSFPSPLDLFFSFFMCVHFPLIRVFWFVRSREYSYFSQNLIYLRLATRVRECCDFENWTQN